MARRLPRFGRVTLLALFLLLSCSIPSTASAQEQLASNAILAPVGLVPDALTRTPLFPLTGAAAASAEAVRTSAQPPLATTARAADFSGVRRPAILPALYASTIALEALDAHSTMTGLRLGATEANPLMKGAVGNPVTLLAVKAGAAAGTIYFAEKLWKRNRVAAVALMAVMNGVTAAVVAHNYKVVANLR